MPAGYAEEGTEAPWWTVTGYANGWVYLIVERASGFRLYILSDEKVAIGGVKTPIASYCGYRIATVVDGELAGGGSECWYFDSVVTELTWRIVVQRVRATTGVLEEVLRERFTLSALMENRIYSDARRSEMYFYVALRSRSAQDGTLVRGALTPGGGVGGVLFIVSFDGFCDSLASATRYVAAFALGLLRESNLVVGLDAGREYLGDEPADVAHALRLVEEHSDAFLAAVEYFEWFCGLLPKRCGQGGPKVGLPEDTTPKVEPS